MLKPETALEARLLATSEFTEGLDWGTPRFGHPEGKVIYHLQEVLENVDRINGISPLDREELRIITFLHDTFKYQEDKFARPRDWTRHHGIIARRFLEKFYFKSSVLDIIELHDEAYYCWRLCHLYDRPDEGNQRLKALLNRLGNNLQLYYMFFKCDTKTGDKNQAPLRWFESTIKDIQIVSI